MFNWLFNFVPPGDRSPPPGRDTPGRLDGTRLNPSVPLYGIPYSEKKAYDNDCYYSHFLILHYKYSLQHGPFIRFISFPLILSTK